MASFAFIAYAESLVLLFLISGVSGALVAMILKLRIRAAAITKDAFLGAIVAIIADYAMWCTGSEYNFVAAIIVAVVVPTLHEVRRSKRARAE